jgi:hypothetical protein
MNIYTKYLGPTNTRGGRIKVWTEWPRHFDDAQYGPYKIAKTYGYPHESHHAHEHCVALYLREWPTLARNSGHFADSIIDTIADTHTSEGYYMAPTKRGYIFTKTKADIQA